MKTRIIFIVMLICGSIASAKVSLAEHLVDSTYQEDVVNIWIEQSEKREDLINLLIQNTQSDTVGFIASFFIDEMKPYGRILIYCCKQAINTDSIACSWQYTPVEMEGKRFKYPTERVRIPPNEVVPLEIPVRREYVGYEIYLNINLLFFYNQERYVMHKNTNRIYLKPWSKHPNDNRHIGLFMHIYQFNNLDNRTFQQQVYKAVDKSITLPVNYPLDMVDYEWINSWQVCIANSLEISRSIISKIQKAAAGEKIERMTLREKGVYVATFYINRIAYPVAVYSEKDTIENLRKVQVSRISALSAKEKTYCLRYRVYPKYVIFSFYEEGVMEPALILQVEKAAEEYGKSTLEEWLKFLDILQPTKLGLMQGVWTSATPTELGEAWTVIKGNRRLSFALSGDPSERDFPCSESVVGFRRIKPRSADSILIHSLTEEGEHYIAAPAEVDDQGFIRHPTLSAASNLYCNGDTLAMPEAPQLKYAKAARLSDLAQTLLYLRGKRDARSYLKEYLNVDAREITTGKCVIHAKPETSTKMYLVKGDVVTVLEEKGEWLRIEYAGKKPVSGWIKKSDAGD